MKKKKELSIMLSITFLLFIFLTGCSSKTKSTHEATSTNEVQQTYETSINLTKSDLTGSKGNWKYKGIPLVSEDQEWIDSSLNKEGTVEAGAMYRKMAYCLEAFDSGNNYELFASTVIGYTPETRQGFKPYADNAKTFITRKNSLVNVMKALEKLDCVEGSFDYNYKQLGKYNVTIKDTAKCAEELQISQEMLGYTLAMLTEYAATIEFNGNSCHIVYESLK